ncbi:MAG: cyclodeaminase/cyclohydrolase family protein [Oscillospiraceae bacterium]|nr:cyclodeaminase/cyclohydrolase family protein [Oscillospiraceae bacterium]
MDIGEMTIGAYMEALRSKAPTPGGGGASAICGALGASLGAMVASLTLGKKKYAAVEDDVRRKKEELTGIADELLTLALLDEQAFAPLAAAYALPADTDAQKTEKAKAMESALLAACMPPLAMMDAAARALGALNFLAEKGSVLAVSDAAAGAALCGCALRAASLNVFINTKSMADREQAAQLNDRANALLAQPVRFADAICDGIKTELDTGGAPARALRGAPAAAAIAEAVKKETESLRAAGIAPSLRIIRAGEAEDDAAYEAGIRKRFAALGIGVTTAALPFDCLTQDVCAAVSAAAQDPSVHGILVMRPLPGSVDDAAVCAAMPPQKDVDGISRASEAAVYTGAQDAFAPCTALACVELLEAGGVALRGKNVAVIGRSPVVGRPLAQLLIRRDATVTVCHTKTADLRRVCRGADIVIAAAGRAKMIDKSYLSGAQTLIDVGIHADAGGGLCGDVDYESCERHAAAISPVPGGVGSVTTAVLARAVVQAARKANDR